MSQVIKVSDIAHFLKSQYYGNNSVVSRVESLNKIKKNTLVFSKKNTFRYPDFESLILVPVNYTYIEENNYSVIKVENPRLSFAKVVNHFFVKKRKIGIHTSSIFGNNCNIEQFVSIGANCTIGDNVRIGKNTVINNNVVLYDNTIIGDNCYIKSGAIIGEDGFGFDFEADGLPIRIPHLGSVVIGNNVEVGSNTVIARGTLNNTIIEKNVKIDDQVFIAHNCYIGTNTIIIASAQLSGSVVVGRNCWIGPNSSIIQKIQIGDKVTIGIGAVVTKNIDNNGTIMGLESLKIKSLLRFKKRMEYFN